jgi:hypothetical protein
MYQKDLIRSLWKSAGLYEENDLQLQQVLKSLDDRRAVASHLSGPPAAAPNEASPPSPAN